MNMRTLTKLAELIRKYGSIGREQLIMESEVSISSYEKLRPFISLYFKDIEYDKPSRTWRIIKQDQVIE